MAKIKFMKKIIISLAMIAAVSAVAIGATTAYFGDTETSSGNTFTAGEIDLTVDNTSYIKDQKTGEVRFNPNTSWILKDLKEGDFFFNFSDLKPGDWGEDTISLHVNNNDSYLCADVKRTSNDDNSITEPEKEAGDNDTAPGLGLGDLAQAVNFVWWADDGDNVLETCRDENQENCKPEIPIHSNVPLDTGTVALADSQTNIWGDANNALPGNSTRYIGKAWCFGKFLLSPVPQDGRGYTGNTNNPAGENGPDVRNSGVNCDGSGEDNKTQTDSMTADISFRAVQSRNNPDFHCSSPRT